MKVTVLGCGPSTGVPAIGPDWGACDPNDPRNRRRRASILIESRGKMVLIDTSPDLREQLLDAGVGRIDAVILTHAHADHLHGIDDLRGVNRLMRQAIPLYASAASLAEIKQRFGYALEPVPAGGMFFKPTVTPHVIDGPFAAAGLPVTPFEQDHGYSKTLGFRIGGFGYSTDVAELDEAAFAALAGIELWVVDCLRYEPHPTHSHVAKTLEWIDRVKPKRTILTHLDRPLDYTELAAQLPPGVEPGYDGLVAEVPDP
jgi:phosphoribosyl 1,2-cyclic phosphate phosphodiesterase